MAKTNDGGDGGQGNTDTATATEKAAADKAAADKAAAAGTGGDTKTDDKGKGGEAVKDPAATGDAAQQKIDADKAAADKAAAAKAAGEKKAPEKYELKVPENSTVDADDLTMIEQIARDNNWDNETAQAAVEQHHDTLVAQSARFLEGTKADKEYGGDNLASTQQRAKSVIDLVRPANHPRAKAFRALLDKSGYGNHVEVISFLADLGKMTEEDSPLVSGGGGKTAQTVEEKLYDGK